ncbi:hypothetical protein [Natrinema thermotolerans]|uniref:hypothetical protein n=1 Tax=Natrinema thermotolerans TaxID=121872 RepID=UPI000678F8E0|nr:hypothetical protein [Natrinema thermotolerans]QCC57212.1 hypothetical protein DVR14_00635 [Natrinema thermotolerans]
MVDTTLAGRVTTLAGPDADRTRFDRYVRRLADGKSIAVLATDRGPLARVFGPPPARVVISRPGFSVGDRIRVGVEEMVRDGVYVQAGGVEVVEKSG